MDDKSAAQCVVTDHLNMQEKFQAISYHSLRAFGDWGYNLVECKCTKP